MFPWLKKSSSRKSTSKQKKNRANSSIDRIRLSLSRMSMSNLEESLNTTADFEETMDFRRDFPASAKGKKGFVKKIFTKVFDKKYRAKGKEVDTTEHMELDESAAELMDESLRDTKIVEETVSQAKKTSRKTWNLPQVKSGVNTEWKAFPEEIVTSTEEEDCKSESNGSTHMRASDSSGYFSGSHSAVSENRKIENKCAKRKKFRPKKILTMLHFINGRNDERDSRKCRSICDSLETSVDFRTEGTLLSASSVSSLVSKESGIHTSSPITKIDLKATRNGEISPLNFSKEVKVYRSTPRIKIMLKFDDNCTNGFAMTKEVSRSFENFEKISTKPGENRAHSWPTTGSYAQDLSKSVADFFEEMAKLQRLELKEKSQETESQSFEGETILPKFCELPEDSRKCWDLEKTVHYEKRTLKLNVARSSVDVTLDRCTCSLSLDRICQTHRFRQFSFAKNAESGIVAKYRACENVSLERNEFLQGPSREKILRNDCSCREFNECNEKCPNFLNSVRSDLRKMSSTPNKRQISKSTVDISDRGSKEANDELPEFLSLHDIAYTARHFGNFQGVARNSEKIENQKVTMTDESEFRMRLDKAEREMDCQDFSIDFDEEEVEENCANRFNDSSYVITMYV